MQVWHTRAYIFAKFKVMQQQQENAQGIQVDVLLKEQEKKGARFICVLIAELISHPFSAFALLQMGTLFFC